MLWASVCGGMEIFMNKRAYIVLEDGDVFEGESVGYDGECVGELVFATGMTGYLELLTDPSYYGQIVMQTFPLIGNYGVIPEDFESAKPYLSGYIAREICEYPSNFRCGGKLTDYLKENKIPAVCGIDTRHLTKIVREHGVMNAKISFSDEMSDEIKNFVIKDAVKNACETSEITKSGSGERKIVLWDFGRKKNIERELIKRGCTVYTVPYNTSAEEVSALNPDGIMLSNGPGDPKENTDVMKEIKKVSDKGIPTFGICLGHQLLALALGGDTEKLKYGHRGANQPALFKDTGKVFITSQNHGYAVKSDSLPQNARVTFENANDGTCEGIEYSDRPAFSVQFHPEACAGPQDTGFLFDKFIRLTEGDK